MKQPGKLFIISGPSQIGKDSLVRALKKIPSLNLTGIVTNTTRARRPGERTGLELNFLTEKQFSRLVAGGRLLEWATVRGAKFGTPKRPVMSALARGRNVIINIEVQGASQIIKILPQTIRIFITAESAGEVKKRIFASKRMTLAQKKYRWQEAQNELRAAPKYDYIIVNKWGEFEQTVERVTKIIQSALSKT